MQERADRLNNQAIMFASDGSFTEAIACFKRAITLDKDNYLLWYNLGLTYRDCGKLKEACESLEIAANYSPDNQDVKETLATLYLTLEKPEKVRSICIEVLDSTPSAAHFWNLLGVVEFQAENYEKATDFFEHAVFFNPYYLDALYNLKDAYNTLGNHKGEIECEEKIKQIKK
ncbi:MAG: tetratricopeptide repeat protein [Treponema sp.]|nr:tetratricopeptide repeat protein [Treponema sp.]